MKLKWGDTYEYDFITSSEECTQGRVAKVAGTWVERECIAIHGRPYDVIYAVLNRETMINLNLNR